MPLQHRGLGGSRAVFALPISADAAPWTVADDHDLLMVWTTHSGAAREHSRLVQDALASLTQAGAQAGADGMFSVRTGVAVDNGFLYVTSTGSAAIPRDVG